MGLDLPDEERAELSKLLKPEELERAARFHFARDRNRFLAARARLRILLGRYLGVAPSAVRFQYGSRGKPGLAGHGGNLPFNLAHSGALALVGVTRDRNIGVDVEFLRPGPPREKIAERFFSVREVAALRSLPAAEQVRAFYNCWTRKEAFLKATGEGLPFGLDRFSVSLVPGEPAALLEVPFGQGEAARWSLRHLEPAPGYIGAVAVEGSIEHLSIFSW